MRKWKGPQIPRSLLHSMYEVHTEGGGYDRSRADSGSREQRSKLRFRAL